MKENSCKDSNGNVICSPVLWEIIANLIENSGEIINRQNAEIDGLKSEARRYKQYYFNHEYDKLEAEAIKDFAERLKELINPDWCKIHQQIDNLVKEMIGEQE